VVTEGETVEVWWGSVGLTVDVVQGVGGEEEEGFLGEGVALLEVVGKPPSLEVEERDTLAVAVPGAFEGVWVSVGSPIVLVPLGHTVTLPPRAVLGETCLSREGVPVGEAPPNKLFGGEPVGRRGEGLDRAPRLALVAGEGVLNWDGVLVMEVVVVGDTEEVTRAGVPEGADTLGVEKGVGVPGTWEKEGVALAVTRGGVGDLCEECVDSPAAAAAPPAEGECDGVEERVAAPGGTLTVRDLLREGEED